MISLTDALLLFICLMLLEQFAERRKWKRRVKHRVRQVRNLFKFKREN